MRVESVDAFSVCSDPYIVRGPSLVEAKHSRVAETVAEADSGVLIRVYIALADVYEAVVDASGPDITVVVGMYAFNGVCRE